MLLKLRKTISKSKINFYFRKKYQQIKQSINLDTQELEGMPTPSQKEWILAQNYLFKKDKFKNVPEAEQEKFKEEERYFQKVVGKIVDRFHISSLTECFIYERSYDIDRVINQ
jgi:hypothetical protein